MITLPKPKKRTIEYYDWDDVANFMIERGIWDEDFKEEVSYELADEQFIASGLPFTISDWELNRNNKLAYGVTEVMEKAIKDLMEHFGEPDTECITPGTLTARFIANW